MSTALEWLPIAIMLVLGLRTWRKGRRFIASWLDDDGGRPVEYIRRRQTREVNAAIGQLQICMGIFLGLSGSWDSAVALLIIGLVMWRPPGRRFSEALAGPDQDYREPIGPEPMPDDHSEPIGPEDRRLGTDGHPLDWDTCFVCRLGVVAIDQGGVPYWTSVVDPSEVMYACRPGRHQPVRDVPPEDPEELERWLTA